MVIAIFLLVYAGMILGRFPRLQLDRTGIALLGAIALLATGSLTTQQALEAIDLPTVLLLFALMVISAQLRLGGFYGWVTTRVGARELGPAGLLAGIVALAGGLSAVFSNDVVCLAMAPVLIRICRVKRLRPVPFLLALACAANVGSAATLIGNPQNMLIGQVLQLSFLGYLGQALAPSVLGLGVIWLVVIASTRGRWHDGATAAASEDPGEVPFDAWQTTKGLIVAVAMMALFLAAPWPREIVALTGAGLLLTSRKLHSRQMLALVDWQLLVLFVALFTVNGALQLDGAPARWVASASAYGVDLTRLPWLFGATVMACNLVSNVPAVMLLLPFASTSHAGALLALASTLSGNLLLIGSIANLIVVDSAARAGIEIDWRAHLRVGIPVALATLAVAALWLALLSP